MDVKLQRRSVTLLVPDRAKTAPGFSMLSRIPSRLRAPPLIVTSLDKQQRLKRERTFASATTAVGKALESLFNDLVTVPQDEIDLVIGKANDFIQQIKHRINKNRFNLKFWEPYISGPVTTNMETSINNKFVDLILPIKLQDFKQKPVSAGYTMIHMSRNPSYDRYEAIRSTGHKNLVSSYKISECIHELIAHICQSMDSVTVLPFNSNSSDYGEGTHQIVVLLSDGVRLTVLPVLIPKVLKKDQDGTLIVARPYQFDTDPNSDQLWRYDNPTRTKDLLDAMNKADRGTRCKALRLAHIAQTMDPCLKQCPSSFITMTLFNMFDKDVDDLPCWQTISLEKCFINILTYWHQHMTSGQMMHSFNEGLNVLETMPSKSKEAVKNRLSRLLANKRELIRLLRLRT